MTRSTRFISLALAVGLTASIALGQPGGDMIAGQMSPWRSAHFVLWAYGLVWAGLALYVWRMASLTHRLEKQVNDLEQASRDVDSDGA